MLTKITNIKPNPRNPRVIKDERFDKLCTSLREFPEMLEKRPLVCFTDTDGKYVVLGGNMRLKAAKEIGLKELPIVLADDWTAEQKDQFLIKDNIGFGEWNFDELQADWDVEQLKVWGVEHDWETEQELEAVEDDFDATPPENPITVLGDLYEIGEHRLLSGDSTDSDQVAKLMDGSKAELMVTDPPYGVNYNPKWREGLEHQRAGTSNGDKILNDNITDWSVVYSLFNSNVIYIWHSSIKTNEFAESIKKAGYELKYLIIWNKDLMVLGRGDYHHKFEPCWYAVKKGMPHNFYGDRKQTTVWDIPTIHSFKNGKNKEDWNLVGHSCQKPVECMIRPIQNNSKENDLIADPFLGSGSTMVAAHQLKRKCYGMELDCRYADVIVKRMLKLDPTISVKRNGIDCKNEFINS
jgi:DNA modification methylase